MRRAMIMSGVLAASLLPGATAAQDPSCDLGLIATPEVGLYGDSVIIDQADALEFGNDAEHIDDSDSPAGGGWGYELGTGPTEVDFSVVGPDGTPISPDALIWESGAPGITIAPPFDLSVPPLFDADGQPLTGEFTLTITVDGCTGEITFGQTLDMMWTPVELPEIAADLVPSDITVSPDGTILLTGNTQIADPDGNLLPPVPVAIWSGADGLDFQRSDGLTLEGAFITTADWDEQGGSFLGSGTSFDEQGLPMPWVARSWDGSLFEDDPSSVPPTTATFVQIPTKGGIAHFGVGEGRLPRNIRRRTGEDGNVFYGEYYGPAENAPAGFFTTRTSTRPGTPVDGILEKDGTIRVAQWNAFGNNGNGLELYASGDDGASFKRTGTPRNRKVVPRRLSEGAGFSWLTVEGGPAWRSRDGEKWNRVGLLGNIYGGAMFGIGGGNHGLLELDADGGSMTWNGRDFYPLGNTAFPGYRVKFAARLPDGRWGVLGQDAMEGDGVGMAGWIGTPTLGQQLATMPSLDDRASAALDWLSDLPTIADAEGSQDPVSLPAGSGDTNGDGVVDATDVTNAAALEIVHRLSLDVFTPLSSPAADVDGDGRVTADDVAAIVDMAGVAPDLDGFEETLLEQIDQ